MTERHISLPRPENAEVAANFVPEGDEEVAKDEIQSTSKKSKDRTSPPTKERLGTASGSSEKPKGHSDGANPADTTLAPPSPSPRKWQW